MLRIKGILIFIRYSYRSQRFMNLYYEGLTGKDAAWACKKYKSHRVVPKALPDSFDKPNAPYLLNSLIVLFTTQSAK